VGVAASADCRLAVPHCLRATLGRSGAPAIPNVTFAGPYARCTTLRRPPLIESDCGEQSCDARLASRLIKNTMREDSQ
jgi:hypothetical protein